jgi:hypothetical protein
VEGPCSFGTSEGSSGSSIDWSAFFKFRDLLFFYESVPPLFG